VIAPRKIVTRIVIELCFTGSIGAGIENKHAGTGIVVIRTR